MARNLAEAFSPAFTGMTSIFFFRLRRAYSCLPSALLISEIGVYNLFLSYAAQPSFLRHENTKKLPAAGVRFSFLSVSNVAGRSVNLFLT